MFEKMELKEGVVPELISEINPDASAMRQRYSEGFNDCVCASTAKSTV